MGASAEKSQLLSESSVSTLMPQETRFSGESSAGFQGSGKFQFTEGK